MRSKRSYPILLLATGLVLIIMQMTMTAQELPGLTCRFTATDSGYAFTGRFRLAADPSCLLDIAFSYDHIRALAPDARTVVLVDSGNNWNRIAYTYRKYYLFQNVSEWQRVIDTSAWQVTFMMVSSKNNHRLMPEITASSGYYQILWQDDTAVMEYYQQCSLKHRSINPYYLDQAEKDAIRFMHRLLEYAEGHCYPAKAVIKYQ